MAGQIKQMLEAIIEKRSQGKPLIAGSTKTKLILKGLNPERYNTTSPDDPVVIQKVRAVAVEFGVTL